MATVAASPPTDLRTPICFSPRVLDGFGNSTSFYRDTESAGPELSVWILSQLAFGRWCDYAPVTKQASRAPHSRPIAARRPLGHYEP